MSWEYHSPRRSSYGHDAPDYRLPPMLQVILRYWCLMLLCSFVSTSAYYLPSLHTRVQSLQHFSRSLSEKQAEAPSSSSSSSTSPIVKRYMGRRMKSFINRLSEQRRRYRQDQYFVDRMFRMFDLNGDSRIEKDEFRAILQFLNIISSPRRY